jgi:hypothetical protein
MVSVHFMRTEANALRRARQDGNPINRRKTVDLPEPFGPRKPKI